MTEGLKQKIEALESYRPALTKRADFDAFWQETKALSDRTPLEAALIKQQYPSPHVEVYDLEYKGYDGTPVHGWYLVPAFLHRGGQEPGKLPCMVCYHGFSGSRSIPSEYAQWVLMGLCVVAVDCRLQGGDTGSLTGYPGALTGNVNSLGVMDKYQYYYRAVYMDCRRAIDFAVSRPEVDAGRIVLQGGSQGGALTMAMAALDDRAALALADVPSNSNIEARIEGEHGSFACLAEYLRRYPERMDKVYETMSYFDTMNMADQITCPVLASVCLKDNICPARCYYATYNRIRSEKEIGVYPFNGHDGGGMAHAARKLEFLAKHGMIGTV